MCLFVCVQHSNGWSLTATSGPPHASCFQLWLPRLHNAAAALPPAERAPMQQPKLQLLLAGLCSASRMCVPRLKKKKKCIFCRRRLDQNCDYALLSANAPPKNNTVSSFHAAFLRLPHPEFPRTQPRQFPSAQTTSIKAPSMSHKTHVFVCVQADGRK